MFLLTVYDSENDNVNVITSIMLALRVCSVTEEIVAVGSRNRAKLSGVHRAWSLFSKARIISVSVEKRVSPQPMGWAETVLGALTRAEQALANVSGADYGVGVEAGIVPGPFPSGYIDVQVAVILDNRGFVSVGVSSGFEVPYSMLSKVLKGEELGYVVEKRIGRRVGDGVGLIGVLTRGVVTRGDLTFQAVLNALLPRMNPQLYGRLVSLEDYKRIVEEQMF